MITASQIRSAEFSRSARGYKAFEVDELLEEAANTIDRYQKENEELTRKLAVLAEKIKEYRQDEESIKQALVTAQRTADSIIKDAQTEADKTTSELNGKTNEAIAVAKKRAEVILRDAEEKSKAMLSQAKERSLAAIAQARDKTGKMILEVSDARRREMKVCEEMKKKAADFRIELLNMYKTQVEVINKLPDTVNEELDFEKSGMPELSDIAVPEIELDDISVGLSHGDISDISDDNGVNAVNAAALADSDDDKPAAEGFSVKNEDVFSASDDVARSDNSGESEKESKGTDVAPEKQNGVANNESGEADSPSDDEPAGFFRRVTPGEDNESGEASVSGFKVRNDDGGSKFGRLKFGDDYDPENDDDDDEFDDIDGNDSKHGLFRRKK